MLTPKGYCSITQLENYLLHTIDADFQAQVSEWIAQMEKFIEKETGRIFIADVLASYKTYEIESKKTTAIGDYTETEMELLIDECVAVTELQIDDEIIDTDDYLLYPINDLPKTRIKLTEDSGLSFTKDEQNIKVKAKWGHSVACPADISFATMIFVVGVINYSGDMGGEVKSESIGSYSITYKDEKQWQDLERAKEILQNYKKIII